MTEGCIGHEQWRIYKMILARGLAEYLI